MSYRSPALGARALAAAGGLFLALTTTSPAQTPPASRGQATQDPSPSVVADLFQPLGAFDLTPDQQRAIERYRSDPSAGEIRVFRVNLNVPKTADAVNFNLVPGTQLMLSTRTRSDRAPDDYSWSGGDSSGAKSASLVVKDEQITGTIRDGDKLYRVRPLGAGATAVIEVDQAKLPPEHPPAFDRKKDVKREPPPVRRRPVAERVRRPATRAATSVGAAGDPRADAPGEAGTVSAASAGSGDAVAADACGVIDVLVAYTPAAEAQAGSIEGLIQLAIDETNQSYAKSGVSPRLRLAGRVRADYVESGDMELDVERLTHPSDGFLDELQAGRDAANADLVVLITGSGNFCGIASDILADADHAFAVVGQNCATGYYSFGHEIGHLQGARHNPEADSESQPFAYGHGFFSLANRKRTVMSYDCPPGCTRIDAWATPRVVVEGVTMGDELLRHDARVLNETACTMAGFRSSAPTPESGSSSHAGGGEESVPGSSTVHSSPAISHWSLLALLVSAPFALARRAGA